MTKKITNEQLAAMIQRGFQETAKKTYVDERHEELAVMIQRGFQETASKSYVDERFAFMDERFASIDERFNTLIDSIRLMQDDIHDIKITLSPLVSMVAIAETDIEHLTVRVSRLEHKTGTRK